MKKIGVLFLWFCAATVLAQLAILALTYSRGNLSQKSITQIIALFNGIDIPGERLKNAIAAAKDIPIPTREEILAAKTQKSLEIDSREKALERLQRQLKAEQERLRIEDERLLQRVQAFEVEVERFKKGKLAESLSEVQKILEILTPEQAKQQIMRMLSDNSMDDVLAIIKGLPEDKRKKILGEFVSEVEQTKLGEILKELRSLDAAQSKDEEAEESQTNPAIAEGPTA